MKKFLCILSIIAFIYPVSIFAETIEEESQQNLNSSEEIVTLEECVDASTAKFRTEDDQIIKAKFLAIDTPELNHPTKGTEPFAQEASEYTCATLTTAKEIKLEDDANSKEEDSYGRKMVWVFVDGTLLQDLLVSKGYAKVAYLYGDYKYTTLIQQSETSAKDSQLGIWSEESTTTNIASEDQEKTVTKKKGFFNSLLGAITNFIDNLLESILKLIEDML